MSICTHLPTECRRVKRALVPSSFLTHLVFNMLETQQTSHADPVEGGENRDAMVSPSSDGSDVTTDANPQVDPVLETLQSLTGRPYRDIEEAKTHLTNLNKMVGDNAIAEYRKKAKLAEDVLARIAQENGLSTAEAEDYINTLMKQPHMEQTQTEPARLDPQIEERLRAGERAEFLLDNPDARKVIDKVQKYASATGQRLNDAYAELYGESKKAEKDEKESEELRKEKLQAQVTASQSSTPHSPAPAYQQDMEKFRKTGKKDAFRSAIKGKFFARRDD